MNEQNLTGISRRRFVRDTTIAGAGAALGLGASDAAPGTSSALELSTFAVEVTPPLGHALMGGGIAPAQKIDDPLFARGFVLRGSGKPLVVVSVEWCEIRNDAFERWRSVLAEAAGTEASRVLVSCVHVHDAPIADLEAQRLLESRKAAGRICDLEFHEQALQRVGRRVRESLGRARPVTHVGWGQGRVEKVGSNRRYLLPEGKPAFGRTSATRDVLAQQGAEGTIDPWLKTLSFWERGEALAALHVYATHPMSYYGKGGISSDFVGMARRLRAEEQPKVFQLYASGCSGNVTAGKYNDGARANRKVLADRIHQAMVAAWAMTQRQRLERVDFRTVSVRLEPRGGTGFTVGDLTRRLESDAKPFGQCLAALGLSWRKRADAGHRIEVPVVDLGPARLLLLPAEAYVEFQLFAQQQQPGSFVMTLGYGECAPGYIPIERAWDEGDSNLHDWCWVARGSEEAMKAAIRTALA